MDYASHRMDEYVFIRLIKLYYRKFIVSIPLVGGCIGLFGRDGGVYKRKGLFGVWRVEDWVVWEEWVDFFLTGVSRLGFDVTIGQKFQVSLPGG